MKKNSFITGTFIATASLVLVKILGMLYVIPFYSIVGTKGGALYSYAYNIYLTFLGISSAGIPSAISKIISEYNALGYIEAKARAFKLGKKLIMFCSILAFILLFVFAPLIAKLIIGDLKGGNTIDDVSLVIRCVSFAVLIIPHLSVTKGFLQGHKYIGPSSTSNIIEQVIRIFIILAGSYITYKVLHCSLKVAVGVAVSGAFFGGLFAYLYLKRNISKHKSDLNLEKEYPKDNISNKEIIKKIIAYAVPFIIINIVHNIYSFTDMVLILRTLNHLGFAAADVEFITSIISTWGGKISMIVNSIASGMTVTLIPSIVSAYAVKNYQELNEKLNKALQIVIFISLPMTIGLSILSTPVWTIFYNTNPYGGAVLKVMIFNALVGNISMIVSATLQSCNRFKLVYITNIVGLLTNALLDVPLMLLCNRLGIGAYYGAVISSFIGYTISIFLGLHLITKEDNFKLNYISTFKVSLKALISAIIMAVIILLVNKILPFDVYSKSQSIIIILIDSLIGAIIYFSLCAKMKIISYIFGDEYIEKIKKLTTGKLHKNKN
jgi:O-antigen/teichoic acid export membrane protein